MPVKIKAKRRSLLIRFLFNPWGKAFLLAFVLTVGLGVSGFIYVYDYYARITDEKLRAGPFSNTSLLYAAARPVVTGEEVKIEEIADYLRRCGYSESSKNRLGWFHVRADAIEVNPGPDSFDSEGAVIKVRGGKITQIISVRDQGERTEFQLEPELITNLFDKAREAPDRSLQRHPQEHGERAARGGRQAPLHARRFRPCGNRQARRHERRHRASTGRRVHAFDAARRMFVAERRESRMAPQARTDYDHPAPGAQALEAGNLRRLRQRRAARPGGQFSASRDSARLPTCISEKI